MNEDRYTEQPEREPECFPKLDRRDFLKLTGGGIALLFTLGEPPRLQAQRGELPSDFNAFFLFREDGRIECFTGKVELGQGVTTSLAQTAAEELEVPLSAIEMVLGDTARCPWDAGTFGSRTTRFFGPPFKAAAARAREVLLELAAEELKVPRERLAVKAGVIGQRDGRGRSTSYGELARGRKIVRELEIPAAEQPVESFTVIGVPTLRLDARDKVTGRAKYAGDIRYPDMLYARILRPPAHRARLARLDTSAAEKLAGVIVVREEELVAVLHPDPETAEKALSLVRAEFEAPPEATDDRNIFDHLLSVAGPGESSGAAGSLEQGAGRCRQVIEHTYLNSYVAHAPIEPHTAVASFAGDRVELWVSSQSPFGDQERVAQALGLPKEQVRVRAPFVGGGFGGKTRNLQAVEAARLSKLVGRPVQVAWTRAEEFFLDSFRPAAVVKIRSGIDSRGLIQLWDYHVYYAGSRGSDHQYDIPHNLITVYGGGGSGAAAAGHPFATGAWRAPGANTNVFARESQIDLMAARAGLDPLEFRLRNTKDPRMLGVLRAVAAKFDWKPAPAPSGRGLGIACGVDSGTYVATIAELEVDRDSGRVQVKRIACAQEMGLVINPEGAKMQMEGCLTMGLGYALTEEIHFNGGAIHDRNFDSYQLPRFSWLPRIETVILEARQAPPQGGGEPAIITMGAVLANAVFDATGKRLYQLPMTPERVRAALAQG